MNIPSLGAESVSERSLLDGFLPRKPVNVSKTGLNAFVNDSRFGTITSQLAEVKNDLNISQVRILFGWDNNVQPQPTSEPDFSFYDQIAQNIPQGMTAIIVLTHLPSWMNSSANWINGDPRETFVTRWVDKVVSRYNSNDRIVGFQIWNEQNASADPENKIMGFVNAPEKYLALLKSSYTKVKAISPNKSVIAAATTSIIQNYPKSLSYNRKLKELGAESFLDIWAIHLYGNNIANIIRPSGVKSFTRALKKPLWVTESGAKGVTKQLEYAERYWTYFRKEMKNIKVIYHYQFTEDSLPNVTYGLKNTSSSQSVSDLYSYLSSN